MSDPTLEQQELGECLAAIVESLRALGYKHPQFTGFRNSDNGGLVILASSPSEKTKFAIEVRTWEPKDTPIQPIKFCIKEP